MRPFNYHAGFADSFADRCVPCNCSRSAGQVPKEELGYFRQKSVQ